MLAIDPHFQGYTNHFLSVHLAQNFGFGLARYYISATVTQLGCPTMAHTETGIIVGLDEIGGRFGRSRWAVARWIRTHGFPAARLPDGRWFTTMGLIEGWIMERRARDPLVMKAEAE